MLGANVAGGAVVANGLLGGAVGMATRCASEVRGAQTAQQAAVAAPSIAIFVSERMPMTVAPRNLRKNAPNSKKSGRFR